MLIAEHLERALAFEKSAAKLDAVDDTELWTVFLMRAATNRLNAALHALGVTEEGPVAAGSRIGDLNHSYKPLLEPESTREVADALSALKTIEDLRPQYVRGPALLDAVLVAQCRRAHETVVSATNALIERRQATA